MIGLTATPANFIDRDTFRLFGCDANVPTFLYDYPQAVKERFLVDFILYQAQTGFQRKGIKGVDLSEEDRNALIEQGIDPDSLSYEGTEIEVEVSNRDTLRKQWEEVMETCLKDQSGQLPGKTIVFAMTKKHAHRIAEVFEEMYPQHVGVIQVITSTTERVRDGTYGDGLISKFKNRRKKCCPGCGTLLLIASDMLSDAELTALKSFWMWAAVKEKWEYVRDWEEHKREAMQKLGEYLNRKDRGIESRDKPQPLKPWIQ
jgi:type I site-specific restriction endonuclease